MDLVPYEELMRSIREKRKRLDVQQKELASRAGVRPSHLNRMERGKADAKYSTVYNVWEQLRIIEEEDKEAAEDLLNNTITWVTPEDTCLNARKIMRENNFSQLPVRDNGEVVGAITDTVLMGVDQHDTAIREIMSEPFPEVSPSTNRAVVEELLKDDNAAVLVKDRREGYWGIITKADLI